MTEQSRCRTCRAPIIWAISGKTGNLTPIDTEPVDNGNVLLAEQDGRIIAGVLGARQADGARGNGVRLRMSHFATCPDADTHRKDHR